MATTTVTATYLDPSGNPCVGRVMFRLVAATYHDGLAAIFPTVTAHAVLDAAGEISVELEPTSGVDAAFDDSAMTYEVREKINGADRDVYYVDIPTAPSVDLGTLTTYDDPPGSVRELITPDLASLGYAIADETLSVFTPQAYGAATDGVTDDTAAVQAALDAAYTAGGGLVYLARGVYRCDDTLTLLNDGGTPRADQPPVTILGVGADWSGGLDDADRLYLQGSVLDLRSTDTPAKLDTRGRGNLTIMGVTFVDGGTSDVPFIQTTNTTLTVRGCAFIGNHAKSTTTCDQDGIVMGGDGSLSGNDADSTFSGYGTIIDGNFFHRIRRGVFGRERCNSTGISNNTWTALCGGDSSVGAIDMDATLTENAAHTIRDNLIEVTGYVYAIRLRSGSNRILGNKCWDPGGSFVAAVRYVSGAADSNEISGTYVNGHPADASYVVSPLDADTRESIMEFRRRSPSNGWVMEGGADLNMARPIAATGSETANLFSVNRAVAESVNSNLPVLYVQQGGKIASQGAASGFYVNNASTTLIGAMRTGAGHIIVESGASNHLLLQSGSGDIQLNPSTGGIVLGAPAGKSVNVSGGTFRLPRYATADRPLANAYAGGGIIFDSTLGKPIYSDGTNWKLFADDSNA